MGNRLIKALERHAYAPEMNKLHLRAGKPVSVPQCKTIKEARNKAFPKPFRGIWARVQFTRGDKVCGDYSGTVKRRADAIAFAKGKHKGGLLLDGSMLPDATYKIQFRFN